MAREYTISTEPPEEWTEHYTAEDKAAVIRVLEFLGEVRWQGNYLANLVGVSQSTVSQLLSGKYPAPVAAHLAKVLDVIEREQKRRKHRIGKTAFVETTIYHMVAAACYRAHLYRKFAVVSCNVGVGKTRALEHYGERHPNTVFIATDPAMTAGRLLDDLIDLLGARSDIRRSNRSRSGTQAERYGAVLRALTGSDKLLILDEAETVSPLCLEYVRRISDKAGVGVVLAGTERLWNLVREEDGRFGQISSRIIYWPGVTKSITTEDCQMLAEANLPGIAISEAAHDALWQVCDGSARVLCEALITGLKDYGLRKGRALTPQFVFETGHKVLGYGPRKKRRGGPAGPPMAIVSRKAAEQPA